MKNTINLESLESRKLLSASLSALRKVTTIGATSGVTAASNVPTFEYAHGTVHDSNGNEVDDSANGIDRDSSIKIKVETNGTGSIDATHLGRPSVLITDTTTHTVINDPTNVNSGALSKVITSGGGDTIVISFKTPLTAGDTYTVELNSASTQSSEPAYVVRTANTSGSTNFADTMFTVTVGSYISHPTAGFTSAFATAVAQTAAGSHSFTALAWGPDQRLYAADTTGNIYAYTVGSDGTLTLAQTITTIKTHFNGNRLITGIVFKPSSTATVMEMWVSDSQFRFGNNPSGSDDVQKSANNFTGEIDALSGTNFTTIEPLVINIPRSVKDHTNNQIVFSPDGRTAYFGIAAMNAMGAPDSTWGYRPENIYSATIMQLRASGASSIYTYMRTSGGPVNLLLDNVINPSQPNNATGLDANGNVAGTHYNIFKGSNPLRIYADGIRNDFDMVFASNGHLYAGINGSSSGGNTPGTPSNLANVPTQTRPDKDINGTTYTGPAAPALTNVNTVEEDTLLDVKNSAYYGHPNPTRGEYVIDGGNPTAAQDPYEFAGDGTSGSGGYAVGQKPDRNYTLPIYDFGQDYSPDGMIQYKSVGGKDTDLNGYIMVARYSSGGDILALKPTADGSIGKVQARIPGLTDLGNPLDLIEDPNTGNVYVAVLTDETGQSSNSGSIQLLKPSTSGTSTGTPDTSLSTTLLKVHPTPGSKTGDTAAVTLTNSGTGDLIVDRSATRLAGTGKKNFVITNLPTADLTIAPGDSYTFDVKGVLAKGQTATAIANLQIKVNAPGATNGYVSVGLRAINGAAASLVAAGVKAASVFSQGSTISSSTLTTSKVKDLLN